MEYKRSTRKRLLQNPVRTLVALAGVLASGFAMAENCTAQPVSGNVYHLVNEGSGKYMDVYKEQYVNGTNIHQWSANGRENQKFILTDIGNGQWTISPSQSELVLDVIGIRQEEGMTIHLWEYLEGDNQKWALDQTASGAYKIKAVHSGKLITVSDDYSGTDVVQASDKDTAETSDNASVYQRWFLNPANGRCDTGGPIGFASQPRTDDPNNRSDDRSNTKLDTRELDTTTGGGNAEPIEVRSCDAMVSALTHSSDGVVVQIPEGVTIDCRQEKRPVRVCEFNCGSREPGNESKKYWWSVGENKDEETVVAKCQDIHDDLVGKTEGVINTSPVTKYFDNLRISLYSNTTLEGLGPDSGIIGATFFIQKRNNIIVRNLSIANVNPHVIEAGDAFSISDSHHLWLDHLKTSMISDGHMDIYHSRNITVSSHLIQGDNGNMCGGKHPYVSIMHDVEATLYRNYWRHSAGRNPKVTGAESQVHMVNNFWKDVSHFGFSVRDDAKAKLDNGYFETSVKPHDIGNGGELETDLSNNIYTWDDGDGDTSDDEIVVPTYWRTTNASVDGFTLPIPYAYPLESAERGRSLVVDTSGPQ